MTSAPIRAEFSGRKDWGQAFGALRKLLSDTDDTVQVFRIMRALNVGTTKSGYERLLTTAQGGRIAYQRLELAELLSNPEIVGSFPAGSVGAAYRTFLEQTGHSAGGLVDVSRTDDLVRDVPHPYAWYGRRTRDIHDIWHLLTGYPADEPLGEACLTAFSYAQTGGPGWALIAIGAAFRSLSAASTRPAVRAIWEGYRNGRRAAWLPGEDYELLLAEPLDAARRRLGIREPGAYLAIARTAQLQGTSLLT